MNTKLEVKTILVNKWRGGSYQPYVAHSKLCEGKLFKRRIEPHTMSEKRHKSNKFADYQKIIVRNSPAFDRHVFVLSQKPLIFGFYVMLMISAQICWQNPWWSLCKLWEHRLDFIWRWLNTVLRAVSGNSRDGACFNLDKQTWQRKKQWNIENDFSKSTH